MHRMVGSYEAKTHLAALLDSVEHGEEILITRKGRPIAILSPYRKQIQPIDETIESLFALRKLIHLNGLSIQEMIDEGRRF